MTSKEGEMAEPRQVPLVGGAPGGTDVQDEGVGAQAAAGERQAGRADAPGGPGGAAEARDGGEGGGPAPDPLADMAARLERWQANLERQVRLQREALKFVRALRARDAWRSPKRVRAEVARLRKRLDASDMAAVGLDRLVDRMERWAERLPATARRVFLQQLDAACTTRGLRLRVVRREPTLMLRVPPFAVEVLEEKGRARLLYAEDALAEVALDAEAVMRARDELVAELDRGFDGAAFFDACLVAYRQALGARQDLRFGDRVELVEFLPLLAVRMQGRRFARSLDPRKWRPYTRGQFAYHFRLLQRAGGLARGGLRLQLGVATGNTGYQRSRTILMENEHGEGERKLTIYFRRDEGAEEA